MAKKKAKSGAAATATDTAGWIDAAFATAAEASAAQLSPSALAVKPEGGSRAGQVIALDSFIGTDRNWFSATFELAPAGDPRRLAQIAALRLAMGAFLTSYPETVSLVATAQSCPPAKPTRADPPVVPTNAPVDSPPPPPPPRPPSGRGAPKPAEPEKPKNSKELKKPKKPKKP